MPVQAVIKAISLGFKIVLAISIVLFIVAVILLGVGINNFIKRDPNADVKGYIISSLVIGLFSAGLIWFTYKGFLGRAAAIGIGTGKIAFSAAKAAGKKAFEIGKSLKQKIGKDENDYVGEEEQKEGGEEEEKEADEKEDENEKETDENKEKEKEKEEEENEKEKEEENEKEDEEKEKEENEKEKQD